MSDALNAIGKSVSIVRTIELLNQIGRSTIAVKCLVAEKLPTSAILRCDLCNKHVEAIKPVLTISNLGDGYKVPTIRQPSKPNTSEKNSG